MLCGLCGLCYDRRRASVARPGSRDLCPLGPHFWRRRLKGEVNCQPLFLGRSDCIGDRIGDGIGGRIGDTFRIVSSSLGIGRMDLMDLRQC